MLNYPRVETIIFESSVTGIFKILLIFLGIYIFYSFVVRFLFPMLIRHSVRSFQEKVFRESNGNDYRSELKKEGDITIEYLNTSEPKKPSSEDEYIDYEEVK